MIKQNVFTALILLTLFLLSGTAKAQSCFEIRSILVDACGSPEGENEMVRFDVGNAPLALADLSVTWPSNSYKGICRDSVTALKVDTLNSGIVGCGLLVEPLNDTLPANAKVLLVTSTDFSTTFNSFANLNDTLIIIFQCAGNIAGHFANNSSSPGLRTLIISFANPAGCIDSVTYDRTLLVNQGGGIGGSSSYNDGALVSFDDAGNATYLNYGCQALVASLNVNAGSDRIFCSAATILFYGNVTGDYTSLLWSGGSGSFNQPDSLETGYVTVLGESGWKPFTLTATGPCGTTSTDTLYVYFPINNPDPILSAAGFTLTCSVQSTNFGYSWLLNGAPTVGNSFILNAPSTGCYSVLVTDTFGCSVASDTVCIINAGYNEIENEWNTAVQPNPSQGLQHVVISSGTPIGNLELVLAEITGRIISKATYMVNDTSFETTLDLSSLSNGIYFLTVKKGSSYSVIKVIKN